MDQSTLLNLKETVKGEVSINTEILSKYSHDASIFEIIPSCVVSPTDNLDIENVVKFVNLYKKQNPELSITARAAGTDMGGGPLTNSILLSLTDHLNKVLKIEGNTAEVEPGVYYRDFEKLTLQHGLIFPAYPSSRELCALGGMIANNCGGEKSLEWGKSEQYVEKMTMVLSDGNTYDFYSLTEEELNAKMKEENYEGQIYRDIYKLINDNYDVLLAAKPKVHKNSAGYFLWNVYDKVAKTFDLTKLFVGSQGTLGINTRATVKLVPVKKHTGMVVIYLEEQDVEKLGEIINTALASNPESIETYDDKTLKLALKYFSEFAPKLGTTNIVSTAIHFLPEFIMALKNKLPKLVLQVEFTGDDLITLENSIKTLQASLQKFNLITKSVGDETKSKKYWLIRRESFRLLKEKIKDKYASPFIDDIVVNPEYLSHFLPEFNALIAKYPTIISTTAGHIGEGNFHIIPLVNLRDANDRQVIRDLSREVYDLVFKYHGSTNGEHNDGLIRTPYVKDMFGEQIYNLFVETKKIFDPDNIFNPGKKVNPDIDYSMSHIRQTW